MVIRKMAPKPGVVGSEQQEAIWSFFKGKKDHLLIEARAGTGKTFTGVEGIKKARVNFGRDIAFVSFNRAIADELGKKVPRGVMACTMHSFGYAALREAYPDQELDRDKTFNLLEPYIQGWGLYGKGAMSNILQLVKLSKAYFTTPEVSNEDIGNLVGYYGIILKNMPIETLTARINILLKESIDAATTNKGQRIIDFEDMLWLPIVLGLDIPRYNTMLVDEAQDLNKIQQIMALKAAERMVIIGDRFQSIYGFRGADADAIPNMYGQLQGAGQLGLTVSRRCPVNAIMLAKMLVPDIEAMKDAKRGELHEPTDEEAVKLMGPADMVMCRKNAPLLNLFYRMVSMKKPVTIRGRDIGKGIVRILKSLGKKKNPLVKELGEALDSLREKELGVLQRTKASSTAIEAFNDKIECVQVLLENAKAGTTCDQLVEEIADMFKDTENRRTTMLTSIHRAKGLEAERIFMLHPEFIPLPLAKAEWERQQELNLAYVQVTRTKNVMFAVNGLPGLFEEQNGEEG